MRLENKVAIVTGAASGFGRGIAERFVEEGAAITLTKSTAGGVFSQQHVSRPTPAVDNRGRFPGSHSSGSGRAPA